MLELFNHYKKTGYLHHAHVIVGGYDIILPSILCALETEMGVVTKANPDLAISFHESFGVDEARGLKNVQTRAAFTGTRKFYIIGMKSFTDQAQNTLLKTFEEPTEGTHFFFIIPREEILLPTLRSRVIVFTPQGVAPEDQNLLAKQFIKASLPERFKIAKKMAEKKAGESVDRDLFSRFLDSLERVLYSESAGGVRDPSSTNIFHEIFQAKRYLLTPGASPKMLLEHIAILIPTI